MNSRTHWFPRLIAEAKTPLGTGPNRTATSAAAVTVPAGLASIAALHAAWALGGRWPGGSDREWAETVGGPGAKLPPPAATWAVAGALALAASLVGAAAGPEPGRLVRAGSWTVATVLLVRGLAGPVTDVAGGLDDRYERLDLLLYSPLCLALGTGAALVARQASAGAPARRAV